MPFFKETENLRRNGEKGGAVRRRIQTFQAITKRVCARRFPKGPEPAAASGTGACRPLCRKKAGGTSGTTRSGESRDYVGSPEDEGRRSVGIAKEQLAATIAIPGPIGKPFDGVEIAEPRAGAVWFFYRKGLPEDQSGSPADEDAFYCSQIERSYALTDRQVTLRSLTAFPSDRFTIRERWGISSHKPLAWGPVPRPLPLFARFQAAMRSFPAARRPSARRPRLRAGPRRRYAPQA